MAEMTMLDTPVADTAMARAASSLAGAGGATCRRSEPLVLSLAATGTPPESDAELHHAARQLQDLASSACRSLMPRAALLLERIQDYRRIKVQVQADAAALALDLVSNGATFDLPRRAVDTAIAHVLNVAACTGLNMPNHVIADRRRLVDAAARRFGCTLQTLSAENVASGHWAKLFAELRRLESQLQEERGC
jgi:hypothetical protein